MITISLIIVAFLETYFTNKVNVKKQRRFDRSTVIIQAENWKIFPWAQADMQSIIRMLRHTEKQEGEARIIYL